MAASSNSTLATALPPRPKRDLSGSVHNNVTVMSEPSWTCTCRFILQTHFWKPLTTNAGCCCMQRCTLRAIISIMENGENEDVTEDPERK